MLSANFLLEKKKQQEQLEQLQQLQNNNQPQDLSTRKTTTTYNPKKRLLRPDDHIEHMRQQRMNNHTHNPYQHHQLQHQIDMSRFDDARTSSPIAGGHKSSVVQLHSDFTKIKREHTDHQYSSMMLPSTSFRNSITPPHHQLMNNHHDHQLMNNHHDHHYHHMVVKPNVSPSDSGHSSSYHEDHHNHTHNHSHLQQLQQFQRSVLPSPSLLMAFAANNSVVEFPYPVLVEYQKIERESNHIKDDYIRDQLDENPVDYEYNPSKSRLRKTYEDPEMEAGRAKNNLASRKSRYKKKLASRLLSINYNYDILENRKLYDQERWMIGVIAELENMLVAHHGVEVNVLKELRDFCGLK